MTLVIPDGFAQAEWRWTLDGDPDPMVSTIGLETPVTGQAVANTFADLWLTQFPATNMGSKYTYRGAILRFGQPSGPPLIYEAPKTVVGTVSVSNLPSNCALLIKKITGQGGRANRGRMYIPMISVGEDSVDHNGNITAGTVTSLQTAWTALYNAMDPVILHDSSSPVITPTPITALQVASQIATQRRRMRH